MRPISRLLLLALVAPLMAWATPRPDVARPRSAAQLKAWVQRHAEARDVAVLGRHLTPADLAPLARLELRSLTLEGVSASAALLRQMPTLRELAVHGIVGGDEQLAQLGGLPLERVSIGAKRLSAAGLRHLAGMKALREVAIRGSQHPTVDPAIVAALPAGQLERLELSSWPMTRGGMQAVARLGARRLALVFCKLTAASAAPLAGAKGLIELKIRGADAVFAIPQMPASVKALELGEVPIGGLAALLAEKRLTRLRYTVNWRNTRAEGLGELKLERLELAGGAIAPTADELRKLTRSGALSELVLDAKHLALADLGLLAACKLERLEIVHAPPGELWRELARLSQLETLLVKPRSGAWLSCADAELERLAACRKLTTLRFSQAKHLTGRALAKLPPLTRLGISDAPDLTDLSGLAGHGETLRSLWLFNCGRVSGEAVEAAIAALPKLTDLALDRMPKLRDAHLPLTRLKQLRRLDLGRLDGLDGRVLTTLPPSLRDLSIGFGGLESSHLAKLGTLQLERVSLRAGVPNRDPAKRWILTQRAKAELVRLRRKQPELALAIQQAQPTPVAGGSVIGRWQRAGRTIEVVTSGEHSLGLRCAGVTRPLLDRRLQEDEPIEQEPRLTALDVDPTGALLLVAGEEELIVIELATASVIFRNWAEVGAAAIEGSELLVAGAIGEDAVDDGQLTVRRLLALVPAGEAQPRERLWAALASPNAALARQAMARWRADGGHLDWLATRLRPVSLPSAEVVDDLVERLGNRHFAERERAQKRLAELQIASALVERVKRMRDLEPRGRLQALIEEDRALIVQDPNVLRGVRLVELLADQDDPRATRLLRKLAGGLSGARLTQHAKQALAAR